MYNDIMLLTKEQCAGNNKLDIFKKRGIKAPISDFAILSGGYVSDSNYVNKKEFSLEDRTGFYYTSSKDENNYIYSIAHSGILTSCKYDSRICGARVVLPFSYFYNIPAEENIIKVEKKLFEVEYGYYPQMAASINKQLILESHFQNGEIINNGLTTTIDGNNWNDYDSCFRTKLLNAYEYEGKNYVRIVVDENGKGQKLSNGVSYPIGKAVWIEVSPVRWLVDKKKKLMVSEKILFAGVQFNNKNENFKDFNDSNIKIFMVNCFLYDLITLAKNKAINRSYYPVKEKIKKI